MTLYCSLQYGRQLIGALKADTKMLTRKTY